MNEINVACFCYKFCDKDEVISVKVGDKKIGFGNVDVNLPQALLHGFQTGTAIQTRIDDQVSIFGFYDIGVEIF